MNKVKEKARRDEIKRELLSTHLVTTRAEREMNMWDAGACAVALAGASPLAKCQLPAKNGDFWEC